MVVRVVVVVMMAMMVVVLAECYIKTTASQRWNGEATKERILRRRRVCQNEDPTKKSNQAKLMHAYHTVNFSFLL